MAHDALRVGQAGEYVLPFHPRVAGEDDLDGVAGGEHAEDVLYGEPVPADDRFAAEDLRVVRDALEQGLLVRP